MNVINFGPKHCEKVRGCLDSYLNNELLAETNHEVLRHLETCAGCSDALESRVRLRDSLRRAVLAETAPADLPEKIRRKIRRKRFSLDLPRFGSSWALAAAASLLLLMAGWGYYLILESSDSPLLPELAGSILNLGLGDHVTCAINHKVSNRHYTLEQMAQEMGPSFSGLVPIVREKAPDNYEVVVAHQCKVNERSFVHVIMKKDASVVSLVITRKTGESFPQGGLVVVQASGISLHSARLQGYQVTGFETRDHLAFIVSDLVKERNLQIATTLAPSVRSYLSELEL